MATFWERAARSVDQIFSLYFDFLCFKLVPVIGLWMEFGFILLKFWPLQTSYF